MKPEFLPVDEKNWPRRETFHYFTQQVTPTAFTVNVDVDVTVLRAHLKERGIKMFPALLYLVSRAICALPDFRLALQDGVLGRFNALNPQYPVFHEDDGSMTFLWTEYDADFSLFYARYLEDQRVFGGDHGIFSRKGEPPQNRYVIACIPWFSYRGFTMHLIDFDGYFAPMIELGGYREEGGRVLMPLSLTLHHAAADGYHVKLFLDSMTEGIHHAERWMNAKAEG